MAEAWWGLPMEQPPSSSFGAATPLLPAVVVVPAPATELDPPVVEALPPVLTLV